MKVRFGMDPGNEVSASVWFGSVSEHTAECNGAFRLGRRVRR